MLGEIKSDQPTELADGTINFRSCETFLRQITCLGDTLVIRIQSNIINKYKSLSTVNMHKTERLTPIYDKSFLLASKQNPNYNTV